MDDYDLLVALNNLVNAINLQADAIQDLVDSNAELIQALADESSDDGEGAVGSLYLSGEDE